MTPDFVVEVNTDSRNLYVNFALNAILGYMGEADVLLRRYPREIVGVAREIERKHPIPNMPLHRGVLLDPTLGLDNNHFPFVSWSEDQDVAKWFADRHSYISEPYRKFAPEARGYLLAIPVATRPVLFHHSWRAALGMPLESFAVLHPLMGVPGMRQLRWSLDHQREVILTPIENLSLVAYEATREETKRLDERFIPSWIKP